jgi:hypothetical protein
MIICFRITEMLCQAGTLDIQILITILVDRGVQSRFPRKVSEKIRCTKSKHRLGKNLTLRKDAVGPLLSRNT